MSQMTMALMKVNGNLIGVFCVCHFPEIFSKMK